MRARWWWLVVLLAIAGCGGSGRPAGDARRDFRAARTAVWHRLRPLREHVEPRLNARARVAPQRCLGDWRAAPASLYNGSLLTLWTVAVTRSSFQVEVPVRRDLLRRLAAIPGIDGEPRLRAARRGLARDDAALTRLYARPVDACAVLREWRGRGWRRPGPAALQRILLAYRAWLRSERSHRHILSSCGLPEHGGYCGDRVFALLQPDDTFCG